MTPTEQIADRLRAALDAQAREIQVSPDAWQRNQRRVAADRSHRNRMLVGAAAAVVAVAAALGAGALLGGGGSGGSAADGSDDPFTTEYLLGEPVEAETLTIDGEPSVHEIALSDMTGEGPSLCDRYTAESSGSGSCTSREPGADDPGVAFDWLSGTEGGGNLRSVLAGVDGRVTKVQIWMDNGDMVLAELHPTGWDSTTMFALTMQDPAAPTPQRLVAYGRGDDVLEAVDLPRRFGETWVMPHSACASDERAVEVSPNRTVLPNAFVVLGTTDARVSIRAARGDVGPACIDRLQSGAIAGWHAHENLAVAVLAPEVTDVLLTIAGRVAREEVKPVIVAGTLWRVATFRDVTVDELPSAELIAFDVSGAQLDREFLNQPASP